MIPIRVSSETRASATRSAVGASSESPSTPFAKGVPNAALKRVARPVILGCLTTVGAFVIIAMSGFTGIRQLALFSIISLPVALLTTLLLIPAFHRFALRTPREFPRRAIDFAGFARFAKRKGRAGVVVAFAALAGGGIWQVRSVELSGDPRSLGYSDPDITQKESRLREVLPGISRQAILLVSGDDEPQCLERNDRLYTALRERGIPAGHIASVSPLLSARETRETALSAARDLLTREETREAFEAAGFTPEFYASLTVFPPPPDLRDSGFRDSGLADMVEESLGEGWRRGEGRQVITRVRTAGERDIDALQAIARSVPGCRLVSDRLAAREALEMLQRELIWMLAIWLAAAVLLLTLAERSVLFGLRAAVPALFGLVFTVGVFSLLSRPLTPVAAAGLTLVMGLGIDYGIFMQSLGRRGSSSPAGAIAASAFTTMAAFGVLSIARTRAMADIGLIIILGLTAALLAALLLVPALMKGDTR